LVNRAHPVREFFVTCGAKHRAQGALPQVSWFEFDRKTRGVAELIDP
jgi:hypothetical protein